MTMSTRVHITDPVDPEALFLHLLGILEADPRFVPSWEQSEEALGGWPRQTPGPLRGPLGKATYDHVRIGDVKYHRHDNGEPVLSRSNEYRSTIGQGLGAILEVEYAGDGPIVWCEPDEWTDPSEDLTSPTFAPHLVSVDFDTRCGWKDHNGATGSDLHAFLLTEVGRFLAAQPRPIGWVWHHEEKGEWFGPDEVTLRGDPTKPALAQGPGNASSVTDAEAP